MFPFTNLLYNYRIYYFFIDEELENLLGYIEQDPIDTRIVSEITADKSRLQEISQLATSIQTLEPILDSHHLQSLIKYAPHSEEMLSHSLDLQKRSKELEKIVTSLLNEHTATVCSIIYVLLTSTRPLQLMNNFPSWKKKFRDYDIVRWNNEYTMRYHAFLNKKCGEVESEVRIEMVKKEQGITDHHNNLPRHLPRNNRFLHPNDHRTGVRLADHRYGCSDSDTARSLDTRDHGMRSSSDRLND